MPFDSLLFGRQAAANVPRRAERVAAVSAASHHSSRM